VTHLTGISFLTKYSINLQQQRYENFCFEGRQLQVKHYIPVFSFIFCNLFRNVAGFCTFMFVE